MSDDWLYRRPWLLPSLLIAAGSAAICLDFPIALAFRQWKENPVARSYLHYFDHFEPFGHGLGLIFLLFVLYQLDPTRRWAIPRVAACALAAGGMADVVKMLIVRVRPNSFAFQSSIWTTFGDWLPLFTLNSGNQSFPSAHTALACGLAAALIWLYPHGRLLFTLLAVLVACQRVISGAHYPSDVLFGAATGILVATFVLRIGRLPRWFASVEASWRVA